MRILLVGDYPEDPRLGSGKVYHKLREELELLGHACDVLLAPQLGPRPGNARVRWLAGPVLAARAVARAFRERGPYDVVDVASAEGALLGHGAAIVSRSHGLEHLNFQRMVDDHRHGLAHKPWHRRLWYPAARLGQVALAARRAHRMIVLNAADHDFVLRRGWKGTEEVELIPHGVSQRFLDAAPPPDAPRGAGVLFCGSWDAMKGIHYLVRAVERLVTEGRAPRLTVLGPGFAADAVLAAFPPGVRPYVTVIPRTDEESVMRHYREHDLLVMPSSYEGFGMVVPEAMSQRLPVVATAVGCAPALLEGGHGILVPPRDAEALAAAVGRLLGDAPLRRRLGEAAHERVKAMSWTETARRTLACYAAAIEARR